MKPDEELLAAYLDGVSELTPQERQRVEAKLSNLEVDDTRGMLDQLRALPPEGTEPDWRAMEKRIARAVDDIKPPWWRRWKLVLPMGVVATTAAALLLYLRHTPVEEPAPAPAPPVAVITQDAAVPPAPAEPTEIWINGHLIDVSDVDPEAFDDLDDAPADVADEDSLLPASDLGWVDQLDDHAIDRAERWLERKKS